MMSVLQRSSSTKLLLLRHRQCARGCSCTSRDIIAMEGRPLHSTSLHRSVSHVTRIAFPSIRTHYSGGGETLLSHTRRATRVFPSFVLSSRSVSHSSVRLYSTTRCHRHSASPCGAGCGHGHSHGSLTAEQLDATSLRQCQRVTAVGAAANIFFSVTKLWAGSAGGSVALMADGFHALTDLVADAISYVTVSFSRRKLPRCAFPFGVGRLETCGTVLVAGVLFLGSFLLLSQSLMCCVEEGRRLLLCCVTPRSAGDDVVSLPSQVSPAGHSHSHMGGHHHAHFTLTEKNPETGKTRTLWLMVFLAASSVVGKEVLFRWAKRVGQRAGSRVVVANAYHHRADAWSGAVALVGVAGQCFGLPGVDGVAGVVVSLYMCRMGYVLSKEAILEFFDYQRAHEVREVRRALQQFHVKVVPPSSPATNAGNTTNGTACTTSSTAIESAVHASASENHSPSLVVVSDLTHQSQERIRFINIFLLRHGHAYAVHVTLLACDSLHAKDIDVVMERLSQLATRKLEGTHATSAATPEEPAHQHRRTEGKERDATKGDHPDVGAAAAEELAPGSVQHPHAAELDPPASDAVPLRIEDTFVSLLLCSREDIIPRAVYIKEWKDGRRRPPHQHEKKSRKEEEQDGIAAVGEWVNPSLERCLIALQNFHAFTTPLRYCWKTREIFFPAHSSSCASLPTSSRAMPPLTSFRRVVNWWTREGANTNGGVSECRMDVNSVAAMFRCTVVDGEALTNNTK